MTVLVISVEMEKAENRKYSLFADPMYEQSNRMR